MYLIPIILCGGAGSRLWPVSRALHPKPFIKLSDNQSLLQKTFMRAALLPGVEEILTVTNRELSFKTEDEYRPVNKGQSQTAFILEPFGRNTAPAIAIAALEVCKRQAPNALMLVLPADHLIADQLRFVQAVEEAMLLASQGALVTFGIPPERPETAYGYIEIDNQKVLRFIEKPSLEKAEEYLQKGNFLWNSGIFCFTAEKILAEMEKYAPEIVASAKTCFEKARRASGEGFSQIELEPAHFSLVPDLSIDYAVFEKSESLAVVPCQLGWSDIGSWNALSALGESDIQGNCAEGEALLHDVKHSYIQSKERLVAALGVENLIIIDTPDALLVADKTRVQEVKTLYTALKAKDHVLHKLHRTVHRPWGTFTILEEGPHFKIKRIEVKPGRALSLQMHHRRSEHWIVVSGMAKVTNGESVTFVSTNESTFIPPGHKHRLENPGLLDLVMIEVQSGAYLGEDDIVRFEDSYGRVEL